MGWLLAEPLLAESVRHLVHAGGAALARGARRRAAQRRADRGRPPLLIGAAVQRGMPLRTILGRVPAGYLSCALFVLAAVRAAELGQVRT